MRPPKTLRPLRPLTTRRTVTRAPLACTLALLAPLALLAALPGPAPAGAAPLVPVDPIMVGRVTDAVTGEGIEGALIVLLPTDPISPPNPIRTNPGGTYLLRGLVAGVSYSYTVSAAGYQTCDSAPSDFPSCTVTVVTPPSPIVPTDPIRPAAAVVDFALTPSP